MKTLWEKEKLLITSNFPFSHGVFYPFGELSAIFIKFEIVVCQLFQFGSLKFVIWKRVKSLYELLPFCALCNFVGKMHNASKFGQLNLWMLISLLILFMIDLYKDNHIYVCVHNFFLLKTTSQKLMTGFLPFFTGMLLR